MEATGPVCIVTGGSRGLGRSIALALGAEKCKVVVNYAASAAAAEAVVEEIKALGGDGIAVQADMSTMDGVKGLFKATADAFDEPTAYRPARSNAELRRHAAFGLGAHRCPGWRLGVLEACEAVQAVLRTCPRLRLAPGHGLPKWKPLDSLNCLEALHVIG